MRRGLECRVGRRFRMVNMVVEAAARRIVAAVIVLAACGAIAAQAQCVTNSQTINNSGVGLVTGLAVPGNGCIVNSGIVTTNGDLAETLVVTGTGSITNSGTAAATADGEAAAIVLGSGSVSNSGTAAATSTAAGFPAQAIIVEGPGSVSNSGTATATASAGGTAEAIIIIGNGSINNSGSAAASAAGISPGGTHAIVATLLINGNGTIINSGSVTANGGTGSILANAIDVTGIGTVINTGVATARGPAPIAIALGAGSSTVINAGAAIAPGGTAILFNGNDNNTLTLLPGSLLIGAIDLAGIGNAVNVDVGNQNLTFNTLAGATVTSNVPFVVSGNRVVTIDPTPFGLADRTLMDFTRAVSGILDGIGGGAAPSGPLSSAFAPVDGLAARFADDFAAIQSSIPALAYADDVFKNPTYVAADGRAVWARGFGGERTQDPQDGMLGAHTAFYGGAVGFDLVARPDLRLGLFAGGGESRLTLDGNAGSTDTDTAFGGLYGRWSFVALGRDAFLDFALHGGGSSNTTSRTINNNTLPGGIEIATASYDSSYLSPELKFGIDVPLAAQYTLTPSLGVRYVAGFFGGYTEIGTTAPLTVASRTIQDVEERGELKLTHATPLGGDLLLTSVHAGAIGLEREGDTTVEATLLGINLPFVTPGKSTVAGVVGGAGFEWRTREGISFFGAGEAIGFSDQGTLWSARGGVRVAF
jgi:uncharacterized protein with beta-barrel porin domain